MLALGLSLAGAVFAVDRLSKWGLMEIVGLLEKGEIEVLPFFKLVMIWNSGISFGLFQNNMALGRWVFIGLALVIVGFLILWLKRTQSLLLAAALGLIIGGALGNVYDRIRFGAVADFFYFHIGDYYWPAFNVADAAITIGAVLFVWHSVFESRERVA